jgi:LysR family nod box-dependent transcriptional activator
VSVLLAPAINTLAKSAPRVTFLLKPLDEQAVKRLHNGEADLLLVPKEHGATDLPSRDLFSDDYVGIGDEANPHLRDGLSLADYQALGHVGVQLGHGAFRNFDIWLRQNYGIARRVEVTTLSFNSVPMLVLGNNRIATLPRRLARLYAQTIPLRLVDLPFDRPASTHVVQWHGSRDRDAGLQWIIDQLVEAAHRQKA